MFGGEVVDSLVGGAVDSLCDPDVEMGSPDEPRLSEVRSLPRLTEHFAVTKSLLKILNYDR